MLSLSQKSSPTTTYNGFFNGQDGSMTPSYSVPSTPSSNSSKTHMLQIKPADFDAAWALISKSSFAALPKTLSTLLEELGIENSEDLSLLDDDMKITITNLMKPIQRKKLREAFGYPSS